MHEHWQVLANRDQLEQAGMWHEGWRSVAGSVSNRVMLEFWNVEEAHTLYRRLREAGMVAFKNWL
jgi:hypothetical protein